MPTDPNIHFAIIGEPEDEEIHVMALVWEEEWSYFLITSGDIQYGVPTIVVRKLSVLASWAQKPKSVSLTMDDRNQVSYVSGGTLASFYLNHRSRRAHCHFSHRDE